MIVYPYWILKFYLTNGTLPDLFQALKPVLGALLLEHENLFCEPLNGPLWYLPAILMMHIIIDWCRKTRYPHQIMIALCIASFFLYATNKYYMFMPNLTPMGLFRSLPFYYIGYALRQQNLYRRRVCTMRQLPGCQNRHDRLSCGSCSRRRARLVISKTCHRFPFVAWTIPLRLHNRSTCVMAIML